MVWYKNIFAHHDEQEKKRIVVDFDGTIAHDKYPNVGDPMPGVKRALEALKDAGYEIIIFTCRLTDRKPTEKEAEKERIEKWMKDHGIPFSYIDDGTNGKPRSEYTIDNKALNYGGHTNDWEKIVQHILN